MKILLTGKSATGKDTIADSLYKFHGYRRAKSYTTRPKRTPDETGHHFVDSVDGYEPVAGVKIQGYDYFLTKEEIENSNVIIVEPTGIKAVCEAVPDEAFYLVYITADDEKRMERFVCRDPEHGEEIFHERNKDDNERFAELEQFIDDDNEKINTANLAAVTTLKNFYDDASLFVIVQNICTIFTRHENLKSVIRELVGHNAIICDDNGNMLVQDTEGANTVTEVPEDVFTAICLASETNRFDIFDLWLSYHESKEN